MENTPDIRQLDSSEQGAELRSAAMALGFEDPDFLDMICKPHGQVSAPAETKLGLLSDAEWDAIKPYLPLNVRAAKGLDPRVMVDAVLYRARHQSRGWRGLPDHFGSGDLLRQRWSRWVAAGVLSDLLAADLDLTPERLAEVQELGRLVRDAEGRLAERRSGRRSL